MTPIAEKRVPIVLDKPRELIFNFTTLAKYEEESEKAYKPNPGKSYWDTIVHMTNTQNRVAAEAIAAGKKVYQWNDVLRHLSMKDLRLLLYSAMFEYKDSKSDPEWPLSINEVSRHIDPTRIVEVVEAIVEGHQKNAPSKEELGEASAPPPQNPGVPETVQPAGLPATNGGAASSESLAAALG